jgi:hypothetical protein
MSETDIVQIGPPMPRIGSVEADGDFSIRVTWIGNISLSLPTRIDLAPIILTYKMYRPLRDNPELFRSVHVSDNGRAIAWGRNDEIDIPATAIEHLASEVMQNSDFRTWLEKNRLTLDAAAAQLGISRRLAAYYASGEKAIPRYIALACAYLDKKFSSPEPEAVSTRTEHVGAEPWAVLVPISQFASSGTTGCILEQPDHSSGGGVYIVGGANPNTGVQPGQVRYVGGSLGADWYSNVGLRTSRISGRLLSSGEYAIVVGPASVGEARKEK